MNKYTFMGNGRNKDFYFTFPFFTKADIIVKVNGTVATGYGVFCIPGTANNDFPFTGGHIHFATAPKATDQITIERVLQYNRLIDYQPTVALNPTTVNQDMNYFFELLKDIKGNLTSFAQTYSEFTDAPTAQDLKDRISAVSDEIDTVTEQIENLGDITTIRTNITNLGTSVSNLTTSLTNLSNSVNGLTTTVGTHTTDLATLSTFKDGVLDYVTASQEPTSSNNYIWYRKYKSGHVDIGGHFTGNAATVNLPVELANTDYEVLFSKNSAPAYWASTNIAVTSLGTTSFTITKYGDNASMRMAWLIINAVAA